MIALLHATSGEVLSDKIRKISPISYDQIKLTNRTLNGGFHVQTIGDPLRYLTFEVLSNQSQVDNINLHESSGGKFKFVVDSDYYIGLFETTPDWSRLTSRTSDPKNRYYTAKLRLNITEVGVI